MDKTIVLFSSGTSNKQNRKQIYGIGINFLNGINNDFFSFLDSFFIVLMSMF